MLCQPRPVAQLNLLIGVGGLTSRSRICENDDDKKSDIYNVLAGLQASAFIIYIHTTIDTSDADPKAIHLIRL